MKIAQISKPWETVPPENYGGLERVVQYLSLELSKNHQVSIFGPKSNKKWLLSADTVSLFSQSMADKGHDRNLETAQALHAILNIKEKGDYDIIHVHSIDSFLLLSNFIDLPVVFTFHNNPTYANSIMTKLSPQVHFVFVSTHHRKQFPWIKNATIIHNGIPIDEYPFSDKKDNYLTYVGAVSPQKGTHLAIRAAMISHNKLIIAGKIRDQKYFESLIEPHIDGKQIIFLGLINEEKRNILLKDSKGFLFPIQWEEPFSTVVMESLAVGTPVIGFNRGSISEIVEDNYNGYVVRNIDEMIKRISDLEKINPVCCRKTIADKFTSKIMATKYLNLYQKIIKDPLDSRLV